MKPEAADDLRKIAKGLNLDEIKHHIFLCTGPKCCSEEEGQRVWKYLKEKIKSNNLTHIYRTRVHCLRVCKHGPIALMYPDGEWYGKVDERLIDRLVDQKLEPEAHCFAKKPLS